MICCILSLPSPSSHTTPRFGRSGRLRQLVNLVVVGGVIDPADTGDREERAECEKMHSLIKEFGLQVGGAVGAFLMGCCVCTVG
jgi:hypothetical protein